MKQSEPSLPHWDLSNVFPGLESPAFEKAFYQLIDSIEELSALFKQHDIDRQDKAVVDETTVTLVETVINRLNQTLAAVTTLNAYLYSFISTNSRDEVAQARLSELRPYLARLNLLGTQFTAWIGSLDVEAVIARSAVAADHAYALRKAKQGALHLMSPLEENLAADLQLTGSTSWRRMFNDYISQLKAEIEIEGERESLPLTAVQNLAFSPDRALRARAYHAELDTLSRAAVPLAAAFNAIKGETLSLARRRGWDSPLDMVLFENGIDRPTLAAMMNACRDAFPDLQRYLKLRARALGLPVLTWYDRLVPLGQGSQNWSFTEAAQFVVDQFATYSPRLQQLAEQALQENWIDAEPRDGKQGGAFCMPVREAESRILMNFESSFTSMGTLAHELGHAYHNVALAQRTSLQKEMPMTLAETASTFCQKIVENAALAKADKEDQLIIMDGLLEYAARVVLGATSNFLFEQRVFEQRARRELSVAELCEMEVQAQRETRGDAIDPDLLHPYRWAYVPHYYVATFYNFPYIFGLLFGLGLYAQYQVDPDAFRAGYVDLLSSTGMAEAAELAARFGLDLRQQSFWAASLDVLRADVDRFESLLTAVS